MLVAVIQLRAAGQRRPLPELRRSPAVVGHLAVWSLAGGDGRVGSLTAGPYPSDRQLLEPLHRCRLNRLEADRFVIVGWQELDTHRRRPTRQPQAWLCRLVSQPPAGAA